MRGQTVSMKAMPMGAGSTRKTRPRAKAQTAAPAGTKVRAVPRVEALAAFIESAPMAVAVTDRELRFLQASPQWIADFGVEWASLAGRSSYDLVPETRERYEPLHRRALAGEHVLSEPERVVLPTGAHRWMMWEASPWRDDDGEVGGLLIISRDVTALKQAEEDVRDARAYAATILENVPTPLIVKDAATGRIMTMNRAMEDLYGVQREEHVGKTIREIVPEPFATQLAAEDQRAIESREPMVMEDVAMQTARGERLRIRKTKIAVDGGGGRTYLLSMSEDITERKKAEEDLRDTRAFMQTILENVPSPLVVKDEGGRVLLMNRAMEEFFGVSREDHIGGDVDELLSADDAAAVAKEDRQVLETGKSMVIEEARMMTAHKGPRYMRKVKVPILNPDGTRYLLAISEDVTERLQAQQDLERTRAFLTNVLDSAPMPMSVKSARDGRIIMMNRANEELIGRSREDLIGKTALDLFPPDQAKLFIEQDRAALESGEVQIIDEASIASGPRGPRTLRLMKVGLRDPDGEPCLMTISEDITERKHAAEELRRAEAFLQTIIENMPAGLTVKDAETGRLLMLNPAVEELYGVGRGENIGKFARDIFPPEQAERSARQDRELVQAGGIKILDEEQTWTKRGIRFIRKKKIVIHNAEGPDYLLSISEDVTDRKLAQDALIEAVARAEAASVAKSEFLANMSHEIRTPLNGVLGLADALSHMDLPPRQQEIVQMILSSGQALTMLLGDVLDLAKAEAGALSLNPDGFSVRETVGQAAFLFERVARDKGLDFKVTFDPDGPDRLVGDPLRIKQVVSNLISNAVKFTSEGEVVVEVNTTAPRGRGKAALRVTVRDTGPGIHRGDPRQAVQPLRTGRRLDHPALRRHGPGPVDRQHLGEHDGRRHHLLGDPRGGGGLRIHREAESGPANARRSGRRAGA